jgi:hypothetical protein
MPKWAGLARAQTFFAASIFNPSAAAPAFVRASTRRRAESGFAVYRNNVSAGLMNFIASRFPVVRAIVGHESFSERVRQFVLAHPPRSPVLLNYGGAFPGFIRDLGAEACFKYVADIAELELARARAYHAADAFPITPDAFAGIAADRLGELRVSLHPSVSVVASRFPIVSVWQSNQVDGQAVVRNWGRESALIARPELDVEVWKLPPGGFAFVTSLAKGLTMAEAIAGGLRESDEFDLPTNLSILIGARIVVELI